MKLVGFFLLVGLGVVYGISYYLNHQTPVPKGCEHLKESCRGCKDFSCGNHPSHN